MERRYLLNQSFDEWDILHPQIIMKQILEQLSGEERKQLIQEIKENEHVKIKCTDAIPTELPPLLRQKLISLQWVTRGTDSLIDELKIYIESME